MSALISASQSYGQASVNTARPWIRADVSRDMPVYCLSFFQPATDGRLRLSRPGCPILQRGGLPVQRLSHTQALTGAGVE